MHIYTDYALIVYFTISSIGIYIYIYRRNCSTVSSRCTISRKDSYNNSKTGNQFTNTQWA